MIESTLVCADECGERSLCATLSFNIMQFSEMKCSIMHTCTTALRRITSARWTTASGNYRPIKTTALSMLFCRCYLTCYSTETNATTTACLIHHQLSRLQCICFVSFVYIEVEWSHKDTVGWIKSELWKTLFICLCLLFSFSWMKDHHDLFHKHPHQPPQQSINVQGYSKPWYPCDCSL